MPIKTTKKRTKTSLDTSPLYHTLLAPESWAVIVDIVLLWHRLHKSFFITLITCQVFIKPGVVSLFSFPWDLPPSTCTPSLVKTLPILRFDNTGGVQKTWWYQSDIVNIYYDDFLVASLKDLHCLITRCSSILVIPKW